MRFGNVRWVVLGMVPAMIAPWFLVGEPMWGWTFVGIAFVVFLGEIGSLYRHGMTLSARFWKRADENPEQALFVVFSIAAAFLIFMLHLLLP